MRKHAMMRAGIGLVRAASTEAPAQKGRDRAVILAFTFVVVQRRTVRRRRRRGRPARSEQHRQLRFQPTLHPRRLVNARNRLQRLRVRQHCAMLLWSSCLKPFRGSLNPHTWLKDYAFERTSATSAMRGYLRVQLRDSWRGNCCRRVSMCRRRSLPVMCVSTFRLH